MTTITPTMVADSYTTRWDSPSGVHERRCFFSLKILSFEVQSDHPPKRIKEAKPSTTHRGPRHRVAVHRPRITLAERLDRVLQRPTPRRTPQLVALRQPARSTRHHRGLAPRLQHQPTPHRPRRTHPHRVRPTVDQHQPTPSRIATGPLIGAPSEIPDCNRVPTASWSSGDGRGDRRPISDPPPERNSIWRHSDPTEHQHGKSGSGVRCLRLHPFRVQRQSPTLLSRA